MDFDQITPLPQESTREFVYRFLNANIMHLRMPPGTSLTEQDIATLLSVSRTPVREAFIQLSHEHLLDILPQKGTYVSLIDLDSVEESKFMRETLEIEEDGPLHVVYPGGVTSLAQYANLKAAGFLTGRKN